MVQAPAIECLAIEKRFGQVYANKNVNLTISKGSIHGIVGENGAGKSTLVSIFYGFYQADRGLIKIDGRTVDIRSPKDAIAHGIGMVHQHFMLIDPLSVIDNILIGSESSWRLKGAKDRLRQKLRHFSDRYGLHVDPDALIEDLSVGSQQRVEILKALVRGAQILILDEPTAVLTPNEVDQLFALLRILRDEGKTILLITHKLDEIMTMSDHVAVMRHGEVIANFLTPETTPERIAEAMVGRPVLFEVEKTPVRTGQVRLAVEQLCVRDSHGTERVHNLSFSLCAGEILGVAGVSGNGQSELIETLAGLRTPSSGHVIMNGINLEDPHCSSSERRRLGLLHIPEDRLKMGLVPSFSAAENLILGFQSDRHLGAGPFLDPAAIAASASTHMQNYDIRPRTPSLKTSKFSGGNQQKLVLAREIEHEPKVLLVGQPTRGVDVGAIEFIHKRLIALRDAGVAILLISVELSEILSLSDRIIVMCGGKLMGERTPATTHERDLGMLMAGQQGFAA